MAYVPPLNGGRINASITGNTAGASTLISTGTMFLAGGSNITLSQNSNTISIVGGAGGGVALYDGAHSISSGTASILATGLTASITGQTLSLSAPAVSALTGAGAVSLSSGGSVISISSPVMSMGMMSSTAGGATGGTGGTVSNGLQLVAGSNVTLSQSTNASGATVTMYAGAGGAGGSVSAGGTNYTNGVSFSPSGALTLSGTNNQTLSMSVPNTSSLAATGGLTISPSGSTINFSAPVVSSVNAAGIVNISSNGASVTISAPAFSAGMSSSTAGGSTGGTSGIVSNGGLYLAAGSNITLSQSTNASGATVSIYGTSGGGGGGAITGGGTTFTSGFSFSPAGALTLSGSNQTLSMSVPGTSSLSVTGALSMSVSSNTVSIGAPAFSAGISNLSNDSGSTGMITNRLVLAGGNNIVLSQSTNASGATISVNGGGGGIALSVGGANYSTGTLNLSAAGALTLSTAATNQTLTMSVPAVSTLIGSNGVTISSTSNTIYVSGNAPMMNSTVFGGGNLLASSSASLGQNSVYILPEVLQQSVSGSIIKIPVFVTNATSAFAAHTRGHTVRFGVYTRNATNSTVLSQMYSTSYTAAVSANSTGTMAYSFITGIGNSTSYNSITGSANSNLASVISGSRELLIAFATKLAPGEYWFAVHNSSSSGGAAGSLLNLSYPVNSRYTGNAFGIASATNSQGIQRNMGYGVYSAATAALPSGISMSEINQTGINPFLYFFNTTA